MPTNKLFIIVLLWAAVNIVLLSAVALFGLQYDDGNIIWWLAQLFSAPVLLVSEALSSVGIESRGYVGFIFITVVIVVVVYLVALFATRIRLRQTDTSDSAPD
ncbi:MAG TPA: hypothetical protein VIT45_06135 [Allosphingosinicella sp.]